MEAIGTDERIAHADLVEQSGSRELLVGLVAAERELMEEIGLLVEQPLEPLFKLDACEDTGMEFCWVYRTQSEGPFDLNPEEIDEGRWFSAQELTEQLDANPEVYSPSLRLIWNQHPY